MKFNVKKFEEDRNYSGRYANWNENLHAMNAALEGLPTYDRGEETWFFQISKYSYIQIGFDDSGNIICRFDLSRRYKDIKKPILNKEQTINLINCIFKTINVFDEFGFILPSTETIADYILMTEDEGKW